MKLNAKKVIAFTRSLCLALATCGISLGTQAQNLLQKEISIAFHKEKLDAALKKLEAQSGITIGFDASSTRGFNTAELNFNQQRLDKILTELLQGTDLGYKAVNNYLIISNKGFGSVSGRVIDEENGQPVFGATVKIAQSGAITDEEGRFTLRVAEGNYQAEISSIGYTKKVIEDVKVIENKPLNLNITMKRSKGQLSTVVITSSVRKESIASLFTQQKNAAMLSDGISAEQISATPDKHIGETLKRITGVSTNDNKRVVVRGIAERYNVTLLDGSVLPSTDVQDRDFEYNLIPSNLIDNVIVAKSVTPDMPFGFGGGAVQINTKAIPSRSFTTFSAGISVNNRVFNKDIYGYARGKYDFLGLNDKSRNVIPGNLQPLSDYNPRLPDEQNPISAAEVGAQNKSIGGLERLGARVYNGMPSQNYQLSMGRSYLVGKKKENRFGFVGSLSYRNTQSNDYISEIRRGQWSQRPTNYDDPKDINTGNTYGFNTTVGLLLNTGYRSKNHQITIHNIYTRMFDDKFNRYKGWSHENPKNSSNLYPDIQEDDRPKFVTLLQNKISGKHQVKPVTIEWSFARAMLSSLETDAVSALLKGREYGNKAPFYEYSPGAASEPGFGILHRDRYNYEEENLSGTFSAAVPFKLGSTQHSFKVGGNFLSKHANYKWNILPIVTADYTHQYNIIPIQEWGDYMTMDNPTKDIFYYPANFSLNEFEGKSINKAFYAMFDQKLLPNLRVVWGVRADHFKLDTLKNAASSKEDLTRVVMFDDSLEWYILPSANITFTPVKDFNIRASYSKSVVRPGLMENARFSRYNPSWGSVLKTNGVVSTLITNYDAKLEWFPGAGEIVSAGYFYKYFDKPAEFYRDDPYNNGSGLIVVTNSDWAKVHGWEFELRKSLGFIAQSSKILRDIYINGNLTLQHSVVRARNRHIFTDAEGKDSITYTYLKYPRALFGQVPVLYNLGIRYLGEKLGVNVVFNHTGYKTFITGSDPNLVEYERPRDQLDAQLSYNLLKGKLQAKFNISNILDAPFRFFINDHTTYEYKPGMEDAKNWPKNAEWQDVYRYKWGFSEKYEKGYIGTNGDSDIMQNIGDRNTFTRYTGTSFSFSLSYNF